MIDFSFNDGGRGHHFEGEAGDCATRAISIAMERDYREVYDALFARGKRYANTRRGRVAKALRFSASPRNGTYREIFRPYIEDHGWIWKPTMGIGTGCKVHLRADELPEGRLIVSISKHICAVINGVLHDTHDGSRDGTRCVYGYWHPSPELYDRNPSWRVERGPCMLDPSDPCGECECCAGIPRISS